MSFGDLRRMKALCYDMQRLAPVESIHIERVGKFVPTKAGDAIVVDLVPNQILVLIYPQRRGWEATMISLAAGTSTVFVKGAESDDVALAWVFVALSQSVLEVDRLLNEERKNESISLSEHEAVSAYLRDKFAVYESALVSPDR